MFVREGMKASPSECALAIEVRDGPRTLISKLKSSDKADLITDKLGNGLFEASTGTILHIYYSFH